MISSQVRFHIGARFDESFLRNHMQLFLIDLDRIFAGEIFPRYEGREPGYGKALLNAYIVAFDTDIKRKLSLDFIRNIHRVATAHLKCSNEMGLPANFQINFPDTCRNADSKIISENPNATPEGFWQLVDNWLIKEKKPLHSIHLKSATGQIFCMTKKEQGEMVRLLHIEQFPAGNVARTPYNTKGWQKLYRDRNELKELLGDKHLTGNYQCFVNLLPDYLVSQVRYSDPQQMVIDKASEICKCYNTAITKASTAYDKIEVIVKHVQLLDQLHPFNDGNVRTCYILLNRLLHEEGLPFTLIANPNRLDCFSVPELVKLVMQGQEFFKELVKGKIPRFKDCFNPSDLPISPMVLKIDDDLQGRFLKIIRRNLDLIQRDLANNLRQPELPNVVVVDEQNQVQDISILN